MDSLAPLTASLHAKIDEQAERAAHLIALLPQDRIDWGPPVPGAWTTGILLGHLLECLAGFCAVLAKAEPERLAHLAELRSLRVNHRCPPQEAIGRIAVYRSRIGEAMSLLADADLARRLPTIFVPAGEPLLTLLLGNLEHLLNHKHQLFVCLKLMGVEVSSRDLYRFRGE